MNVIKNGQDGGFPKTLGPQPNERTRAIMESLTHKNQFFREMSQESWGILERINPETLENRLSDFRRIGFNTLGFYGAEHLVILNSDIIAKTAREFGAERSHMLGEFLRPLLKRKVLRDRDGIRLACELSLDALAALEPKESAAVLMAGVPACADGGVLKEPAQLRRTMGLLGDISKAAGNWRGHVLGEGLVSCVQGGVVTDVDSLEVFRNIAGRLSEGNYFFLDDALPAAKRTGAFSSADGLRYVAGRLLDCGTFEDDFWIDFGRSCREVSTSPEEVERLEHIPLPVFFAMKKHRGDDFRKAAYDWRHIGSNRDSMRLLVHFLGRESSGAGTLLPHLERLPGREMDAIVEAATILDNAAGIIAPNGKLEPPFKDPQTYEAACRKKALDLAVGRMGLSAVASHYVRSDANSRLASILSSLSGFLPERQMRLLAEMTEACAKNEWGAWRYDIGLGREQLGFLDERQRDVWRENQAYEVRHVPAGMKSILQELPMVLDELKAEVRRVYPDADFTPSEVERLRKEVADRPKETSGERRAAAKLNSKRVVFERLVFLGEATGSGKADAASVLDNLRSLRNALGELNIHHPEDKLSAVMAQLGKETGKVSGRLILEETDDLTRMLDTGMTPVRTCLQWLQDTRFNVALPHYPADANVKMLILRDENGNVAGRKVFRCHMTDKGPRILLEPDYPHVSEYDGIFKDYLSEKAKRMGIKVHPGEEDAYVTIPESRNGVIVSDLLSIDEMITTPANMRAKS